MVHVNWVKLCVEKKKRILRAFPSNNEDVGRPTDVIYTRLNKWRTKNN